MVPQADKSGLNSHIDGFPCGHLTYVSPGYIMRESSDQQTENVRQYTIGKHLAK
jgi:hypothetical protein